MTAVVGADGVINLFLVDVGGGVYTCRGSDTAWGSWVSVAHGASVPGAAVAVFPTTSRRGPPGRRGCADPDGGVYVTTGLSDQWGSWAPLAEGSTGPGSPVTAVQLPAGARVLTTLVMAGGDGGVLAKRMVV